MINKIIVATNNQHKIDEIKKIFSDYNLEIFSLKDAHIVSNPEENGMTFEDNALIKANAIKAHTEEVILSDDSGLCVHAMNDFPGTHSSRFMEDQPYCMKWKYINDKLKDSEDKSAHFECVICILNLEDNPLFFKGKTEGLIVEPRGNDGFGYDPIFYVSDKNKTFAEMTQEEKNAISHRGKALETLLHYLLENKLIEKRHC